MVYFVLLSEIGFLVSGFWFTHSESAVAGEDEDELRFPTAAEAARSNPLRQKLSTINGKRARTDNKYDNESERPASKRRLQVVTKSGQAEQRKELGRPLECTESRLRSAVVA